MAALEEEEVEVAEEAGNTYSLFWVIQLLSSERILKNKNLFEYTPKKTKTCKTKYLFEEWRRAFNEKAIALGLPELDEETASLIQMEAQLDGLLPIDEAIEQYKKIFYNIYLQCF